MQRGKKWIKSMIWRLRPLRPLRCIIVAVTGRNFLFETTIWNADVSADQSCRPKPLAVTLRLAGELARATHPGKSPLWPAAAVCINIPSRFLACQSRKRRRVAARLRWKKIQRRFFVFCCVFFLAAAAVATSRLTSLINHGELLHKLTFISIAKIVF